ncbi:MAG: EpsG family protein [Plesiomonas sp.]|uniref:EpsG family protein n=1 Tax=Plesiomonas sp. TaxID=2486279 RepID=UPI003F3A529D
MIVPINKLKAFCFFIMSLFPAFFLISLPNDLFRDRDNYIIYARESARIIQGYDGIAVFTNEPLFLLLNRVLSIIFPPEIIPLIFVFFVFTTVSFFIFRQSSSMVFTVFGFLALILTPQSLHMLLVVLRQSFSAALLMWVVYFFWGSRLFWFFSFCLGFIHSSAFMIFSFLLIDNFFSRYVTEKIVFRVAFLIFISAIISFTIMPVAGWLELRQTIEYDGVIVSVGGGGFIVYISVLLISLTQEKKVFMDDGFYIVALVGLSVYLGMYFFSPFSGRLITSFIPFIICLMCRFRNLRAVLMLAVFIAANFFILKSTLINNSFTDRGVMYFSDYNGGLW